MNTITFSPITPILENKTPGSLILGSPGSGKTFCALNIATNCLLTGIRVFVIDPKNDFSKLRYIDPNINIIDINDVAPGALNPFKVLKEVTTNSLISIIQCICGDLDDSKLSAITPIVNDFVNKNKRNLSNVNFSTLADYLYASENIYAQNVGNRLKTNEDSKYGKLLFASDNNKDLLAFDKNRSTIISLFGMKLPNSNTRNENLTTEERFSSGILYIVCQMLRDILTEGSKRPTLLIVDEAHIAYMSQALTEVIDTFLVLGRSLNVATLLISQNLNHFPKGIAQFMSNKFLFRCSINEARDFLEEFDASDDGIGFDRESIVSYITNAESGEAFFIDRMNRGAFIKIKSNLGPDITSNPLFKKD